MNDDIVARLRAGKFNWDCDEAADEIERLRAALEKIMQKCPYARKDQWCAGLNCTCVIIRAALEGGEEKCCCDLTRPCPL